EHLPGRGPGTRRNARVPQHAGKWDKNRGPPAAHGGCASGLRITLMPDGCVDGSLRASDRTVAPPELSPVDIRRRVTPDRAAGRQRFGNVRAEPRPIVDPVVPVAQLGTTREDVLLGLRKLPCFLDAEIRNGQVQVDVA